jgi:hypothetical protein
MSKSSRPMVRIHDLETDTITDREMNDAEYAEWQANQETNAKAEAEAKAKADAKAALLAKLGITEEDAKLLLS